jgi:hypothetical protein
MSNVLYFPGAAQESDNNGALSAADDRFAAMKRAMIAAPVESVAPAVPAGAVDILSPEFLGAASGIPENNGRVVGGNAPSGGFIDRGSVAVTNEAVRVDTADRGSFHVQHRTVGVNDARMRRFSKFGYQEVIDRISFPVAKQSLYYVDPTSRDLRPREAGQFGIVRQDTGSMLGVVSESYGLVTHRQALEPALDLLAGAGFAFKHVALKNDGARLVIEAVNIQNEIVINGDAHFPKIQLVNSYDKSTSIKFNFGFYRLACLNGMMVNNEDFNFNFSTRHHSDADNTVDRWKKAILNEEWIEQYRMALEILNKPIDRQKAVEVLGLVFDADLKKNPLENRNVKRAAHLMVYGSGQAHDPSRRLTAWDVYNGVTETLRESIDKSNSKNEADRLMRANDRAVIAYRLLAAWRTKGDYRRRCQCRILGPNTPVFITDMPVKYPPGKEGMANVG